MFKKYINNIIIASAILCSASSCTQDFEELNTNPHEFQTATPDVLFPGVVKKSLDVVKGDPANKMYLQYSHYTTAGGGPYNTYWYSDPLGESWWEDFYTQLIMDLQSIIDLYGDNPRYVNQVGMAKIYKSYLASVILGTWGPMPYSEAWQQKLSIGFDSEEEVLESLLTTLSETYEVMETGEDTMDDPIFHGDIDKWRKFANTLSLKLALRYQNMGANITDFGKLAMEREADLIGMESESVVAAWGTLEENWNYFYREFRHQNSSSQLQRFSHVFYTQLRDLKDPRVEVYAQAPVLGYTLRDTLTTQTDERVVVEYNAPFVGKPKSTTPHDNWALTDQQNPYSGLGDDSFSDISEKYYAKDYAPTILGYAETCFMKAEAKLLHWGGGQSAEAYYNEGIRASFAQHEISESVDTYLENDGVKWGTKSEGVRDYRSIVTAKVENGPIEQVLVQRWIAGFFQGFDAWCLIRRTNGIFDLPPHFNSDQNGVGQATNLPERILFPTKEQRLNTNGYYQGLAHLGGADFLNTRLKLSVPKNYKDWGAMNPIMNTDVLRYYYGTTLEEYEAAGIDFEIIERL
ncbi:SusD/RagB family nutrient-binding outer membrane lipoprotein [Flammeovirga agarivorans]|uniref:SusD/RagB family nutrient-binding outer membrane lipoprotein n=1 Tax=Flammeovirga agarivorans TaxID=2726742 RepID=A0A7X8XYM8_9BACT|nr:SusD/RagB family nutrient-binding outer membrane lipoprotein [Flammeovirga agarivorans]NLR94367.1 SusD/RagB family nutrient-binding outer membrane lipoprotein [Flammeovirga agarivorans]